MIFLLFFSYFAASLYIFELFIFELIIYLSVILSSGYRNLYPAMLYFCIIKSYQKAGYYIMRLKALKAAFPSTLPIFTGFWFLEQCSPASCHLQFLMKKDQLLHSCSISENFCRLRYSVCLSYTASEMWI